MEVSDDCVPPGTLRHPRSERSVPPRSGTSSPPVTRNVVCASLADGAETSKALIIRIRWN
ncbi:MAG: hypothetical protein ACYSVY_28285 [Planctomycetota bacterium]